MSNLPGWPPPAPRVIAVTLSAVTVVLALTGNTTVAAAAATGAFVAGVIDLYVSKGNGSGKT